MLSLILVVVIVSWIIYRIKNNKKILSLLDNPTRSMILVFSIFIIGIVYFSMIYYIQNYDRTVKSITYCKNNNAQLEDQIAELDASIIEEIGPNSKLSKEERSSLLKEFLAKREKLNEQITSNTGYLNDPPISAPDPKRLKLYKFLLYFGD